MTTTSGALEAEGSAEELLYESARTRVVRVRPPGRRPVVSKLPVGPGAIERLRHERTILERLDGLDGICHLAEDETPASAADSLVLVDARSPTLGQILRAGPLATEALLDLAGGLARAVAGLHAAGVVHKDINPANVIVTADGPMLIDFDLAMTSALEQPGFAHHDVIEGTLAYLAPEQTGRTGRLVDHRADLYSLGATLYHAATGAPPFGDGDPLQLVHDHLARVPVPPRERNPAVPASLSAVILRLLEKEPDARYQSAEGLEHDVALVRRDLAEGNAGPFPLGTCDYPLRLSPPSRLVGRAAETEVLRRSLDEAVRGHARVVVVRGGPGVGKTALIDELRPMVTAAGGWFVAGKFDQYRQDLDADGLRQALRALGRLLLAEPDAELTALRQRLLAALGPNAAGTAALLPEFAVLLDTPPELASADPSEAGRRVRQAGVDLLGAVASPSRPLVIVVDDLQWATPAALELFDAVITDDDLQGVLLVGSCRDGEVDAAHPLTALLARWERLGLAPTTLALENLPPAALGELLAELLGLEPDEAERLAAAVGLRTGGNPYDTLELVNGLRSDGALVPTREGWRWDDATLRRYVGRGDVIDLLAARIARLPEPTRRLLETMACLGGEVPLDLLEAATGLDAGIVAERLGPALEDGLLVMSFEGQAAVRFRHDRVHEAAHLSSEHRSRQTLHLELARRLTAHPRFAAAAAEQYLAGFDCLDDAGERRLVADLFRRAASGTRLTNPVMAERLLAAARALLDDDDPLGAALATEHHAALYNLGRYDEADAVFASIRPRRSDPLELVEATCVQVSSLANRERPTEALALGLDLLARLGVPAPDDVATAVLGRIGALSDWVATADVDADLARPDVTEPELLAVAALIERLLAPALFCDRVTYAWLVLEGHRVWVDHGPSSSLVSSISAAAMLLVVLLGDHRGAYDAARHALAFAEGRGDDAAGPPARFLFSLSAAHWFEPLENSVGHAQQAREELQRIGDLQYACFSYGASMPALLDSSPTLDRFAVEADASLAFAARTGNEHATGGFLPYRQLARALRGETAAPGSFTDGEVDEAAFVATLDANPGATGIFHVHRALSAAIFGDTEALATHTETAMTMLDGIAGRYPVVTAHLLRALAAADAARAADGETRTALQAELRTCREVIEGRAADAPGNFRHLVHLLDAELARIDGDVLSAVRSYDAALVRLDGRSRPWHHGLIAERAARTAQEHGLDHAARALLVDARHVYEAWGATAKVAQLEQAHPWLVASGRRTDTPRSTVTASTDSLDLLGVIEAARALSSETNLDRLRARVEEILRAMTGATTVRLVLADPSHGWVVPPGPHEDGAGQSVDDAAAAGLLPLSAFRYAERTGDSLVVDDATNDDRFARDPYFGAVDRCSLLVVPVLTRGVPQAMLLLENRLSRGAFTAERLDGVQLVAGQLAVSLENARVYASLERTVAERTDALQQANERLEALSVTDPLTGVANRRRLTDVLDAEWVRAARAGTPLALMMVDIDRFKPFNDRYGHIAGDECLRRVADALRQSVRPGTDLVARYGGEEFVVVLPGADRRAAEAVAERARAAVVAMDQHHDDADEGVVTISIGVAAAVPSAEHDRVEAVLAQADARLYDAKHGGRNRVES